MIIEIKPKLAKKFLEGLKIKKKLTVSISCFHRCTYDRTNWKIYPPTLKEMCGNKFRDPQVGNLQKMRELGTFDPKWISSSSPFPQCSVNSKEQQME